MVTLSSTEAEFVAAVNAGCDAVWYGMFCEELGLKANTPFRLNIDNQSAIQVAKNPKHHGRMRQIDLKYYWLRDMVNKKIIKVGYVPTGEMPADLLTKALSPELVERHRAAMGLL